MKKGNPWTFLATHYACLLHLKVINTVIRTLVFPTIPLLRQHHKKPPPRRIRVVHGHSNYPDEEKKSKSFESNCNAIECKRKYKYKSSNACKSQIEKKRSPEMEKFMFDRMILKNDVTAFRQYI